MTAAALGAAESAGEEPVAPPRPSYRRSFALGLAGNVGYAAAQYGLLVVLARLGSPEMVGQYSLALAFTAPVFMFANARLAVLLASDARRERAFAEYLSARVLAAAAGSAVVVAAGVASGYRGLVLTTLVLVTVAKVVESLSDLSYGYLAFREAFGRQTLSLLVRGFGAVAAAAVAARVTGSLAWVASSIALVWFAALAVIDLPAVAALAATDPAPARAPARRVLGMIRSVRLDRRALGMLRESAPLGFVALAASLAVSLPRFVIERELGDRALGYFSALAYLVVAGRMVAIALGSAAVPRLGRYLAAGDGRAFARTLLGLVAFGASLGAVGVLGALVLGRPVLALLYGADYAPYASLLVWLMGAAGLGYMSIYLQDALTTMRSLIPKAVLLAAVAVSAGLLARWLVPWLGLEGAAIAVCGAAGVELLGSAALVVAAMRGARHGTFKPAAGELAADLTSGRPRAADAAPAVQGR